MIVGASQVDITPEPGIELSGFAARTQPSTGVLDHLYASALYLSDGRARLLWVHADLIGVASEIVEEFRAWASAELHLGAHEVILSATHTHSGPPTIHLEEAGRYDAGYASFLQQRIREATEAAIGRTETCSVVNVEGRLDLAVDRRQQVSAHADPQVGAVGFRRANGEFVACLVNYPMHAVARGPSNRMISGDIPGQAARALSSALPGGPIVLVTNGACGNLNPPAENVPVEQVAEWGRRLAESVRERLADALPLPDAILRTGERVVKLPLEVLDSDGIRRCAERVLQYTKPRAEWGVKFERAVATWERTMSASVAANRAHDVRDAELLGVRIGSLVFLAVNAEVFSSFTEMLRRQTGQPVYVVGYANGDLGYIPTLAAYQEGGYEVELAHLFYGSFRLKPGGLETLAEHAAQLIRSL